MDARRYLAIYLDDHLIGAGAGLALFQRAARGQRSSPAGPVLEQLTADVREDYETLRATARALGVAPSRWRPWAGWAAEKAGRLKLNGHLLTRSPLSDLVELEGLALGVRGKEAGWLALRAVADRHDALDPAVLDRLVARARAQAEVLEGLRRDTAARVLGG